MARLWKRHPRLVIAFALAFAVTVVLAVRATVFTVYWSDPARRDAEITGWMTPRYVAMSWQVPPEVVAAALGIAEDGTGRRVTLAELAKARGLPLQTLASELEDAIRSYRDLPR